MWNLTTSDRLCSYDSKCKGWLYSGTLRPFVLFQTKVLLYKSHCRFQCSVRNMQWRSHPLLAQ